MNKNIGLDPQRNMMVYHTTPEDRKAALDEYNARFSDKPVMNKRTVYCRKNSQLVGILGEVVFRKLYPNAVKSTKDLTYDFDLNQAKVDVKCKCRNVPPSLDFEASFFLYQTSKKFNADTYYFMSTTPDMEYVWLCGWGDKEEILNNPNKVIWLAGEVDPSNHMSFQEDTLCLKYKYLRRC